MKIAIAILTLLFGSLYAKAQIPQPDPDTTAKHFLIIASIKNLQEVSSGQLAAQMASRTEVKSFGLMMIKDHGDAEQKLLAVAKAQGIQLPTTATGGIQPDLLLKNAGRNFDNLYVHGMVAGHANTVQVFENYAITGKNPAIKAFAQQMLPVIRQHLAEIKAIDKQIK
jgi:putative membrane protein